MSLNIDRVKLKTNYYLPKERYTLRNSRFPIFPTMAAVHRSSLTAALLALLLYCVAGNPNAATSSGARRDLRPAVDLLMDKVEDIASNADIIEALAAGLAAATPQAVSAVPSSVGSLGPVLCKSLDCPSYKVWRGEGRKDVKHLHGHQRRR